MPLSACENKAFEGETVKNVFSIVDLEKGNLSKADNNSDMLTVSLGSIESHKK